MAGINFITFYIVCMSFVQELVFCDDYGKSGGKITLTPNVRGKLEEILWKHNGDKVLDYDGSETMEYGSFKGRVVVVYETGQLTINKLNPQDSGRYQSDILINGKIQNSDHTVEVMDGLSKPEVTCELDDASDSKTLMCSVESETQKSYEWTGPTVSGQQGPTLSIQKQEDDPDSVYTCTVKNKVSVNSTDFPLKDCYADRSGTAVLASVITIILLLIVILVILLALYSKRKKEKSKRSGLKKSDPENGEQDDLLRNFPSEVIPGSSDATVPCHVRLTSPKESIAHKNWNQMQVNQESLEEDIVERDEGETHVKSKNGLQEENRNRLKDSEEMISNTEQDQNIRKIETVNIQQESREYKSERQKSLEEEPDTSPYQSEQDQGEKEKKSEQLLENKNKEEEESPEQQNERLEKQKNEVNETNNEDDQTQREEIKTAEQQQERNEERTEELNHEEKEKLKESSSDATLPCNVRLATPKDSEEMMISHTDQSQNKTESVNIEQQSPESETTNEDQTETEKMKITEKQLPEHTTDGTENSVNTNSPIIQSPESAVTEENTEESQNEVKESDKSKSDSEKAPEVDNKLSKPDTSPHQSEEVQGENESVNSQILEEKNKKEEESPEQQNERLGKQKNEANETNNEDDQTQGEEIKTAEDKDSTKANDTESQRKETEKQEKSQEESSDIKTHQDLTVQESQLVNPQNTTPSIDTSINLSASSANVDTKQQDKIETDKNSTSSDRCVDCEEEKSDGENFQGHETVEQEEGKNDSNEEPFPESAVTEQNTKKDKNEEKRQNALKAEESNSNKTSETEKEENERDDILKSQEESSDVRSHQNLTVLESGFHTLSCQDEQVQEENKERSQIPGEKSKEENSFEQINRNQEKQNNEATTKNKDDQTPGEKINTTNDEKTE